jgi:transaldolase/glucose-6-phosphate isomerase
MAKNPLQQLREHGQSIWLDYISRELVTTDRLRRYIDEDCVSGLTSNPTIFQKAVAEGDQYDEQLRQLAQAGITSPDELFLGIAISDIQRAADALRGTYDDSGGRDGFVSLELAPALAHDTDASVATAQLLWERVERPNLMIKVPATPQGIPAVERLIAAGVNVNITLIFALTAYEKVAEAYIRGLEARRDRGEGVDAIGSVASFFVSRVDTAVDRIIGRKLEQDPGNKELESLLGTAAIANARLAYEKFEQIFRGERFAALRQANAAVQRPLWASTSAKNPKYRDVIYAEALIGPDTVDTMPPQTIEAFRDHGIVAGDTVREYEWAHDIMRRLDAAGIDMDEVTADLLDEGLQAFADSYNDLIRSIAEKADVMRGGMGRRHELHLGVETDVTIAAISSDHAPRVVKRVWDHDPTLWKEDPAHAKEITSRLGWLDVVDWMRERLPEVRRIADQIRSDGITDVVVLGMGGSSLAPEVLRQSFGPQQGHPALHVLDTTDPVAIKQLTDALDPRHSLFVVSSKSGGTVETLSHFAHFHDVVRGAGVANPGSHFVAITDPGSSLAALAREHGFRHVFENRPDIGGRYSALSYFGMVPAAFAGIDVATMLDRAARMTRQCRPDVYPTVNAGLVLGTAMGLLHGVGRDKVTILAPPPIASFGLWAEQLIAESTGKEDKGIVPIAGEPIGPPEVYFGDRLFVALRLGDNPEFDRALEALEKSDQPVITLLLDDLHDLGAEFFRWEFAVAVASVSLQIDPFDQPNVQESKDNTNQVLDAYLRDGRLPRVDGGAGDAGERVRELVDQTVEGDYVAVLAFVTPNAENEAALQELRVAIRDRRDVATTLGFGPRYLHSTGQLHKGGPNIGVFLEITTDDPVDVPIPGQNYTFSVLKQAQAIGDLQSLRAHERRAVNVHVSGNLTDTLRGLADAVRGQVEAVR